MLITKFDCRLCCCTARGWRCSHIIIFRCVVIYYCLLLLFVLTSIMSESIGSVESGDGYLVVEESSFEEDCQFIICLRNNNNESDRKRRRGGGSKKGKSRNKNRNRALGHSILIQVRCCCCCFLLIVAFVLFSHSIVSFLLQLL